MISTQAVPTTTLVAGDVIVAANKNWMRIARVRICKAHVAVLDAYGAWHRVPLNTLAVIRSRAA